jgi:phage-related protein
MPDERRIVWNRAAEKDFAAFPDDVKVSFRMALEEARQGQHPTIADPYGQPLGAGYYKLKDDDTRKNTYRGVYCVRYKEAVYVLHVFQKKSKSGKADPPEETNTAKGRAKWAELQHALWELDQTEKAKSQQPKKKGGMP